MNSSAFGNHKSHDPYSASLLYVTVDDVAFQTLPETTLHCVSRNFTPRGSQMKAMTAPLGQFLRARLDTDMHFFFSRHKPSCVFTSTLTILAALVGSPLIRSRVFILGLTSPMPPSDEIPLLNKTYVARQMSCIVPSNSHAPTESTNTFPDFDAGMPNRDPCVAEWGAFS